MPWCPLWCVSSTLAYPEHQSPCHAYWLLADDHPLEAHNLESKHSVSAKYVGQSDISRCSSPVSDGRLKNACPNVQQNFQTFINNLADTSENTAPLTMKDQYIPIKWGYFAREHCRDKLCGGCYFVTTAHLHCAGSSSRLWAVLLIAGLCSPGLPPDKNSFPLSNMVVFASYLIKFDSWVHVAYCGRHFTNIVS